MSQLSNVEIEGISLLMYAAYNATTSKPEALSLVRSQYTGRKVLEHDVLSALWIGINTTTVKLNGESL